MDIQISSIASHQFAQQQLAAFKPIADLAQSVFLEHAGLPELHRAQEQEQIARDTATLLALAVLARYRELQAAVAQHEQVTEY